MPPGCSSPSCGPGSEVGRAAVLSAIKAFLQPPAVPFLYTVYGAADNIPDTALDGVAGAFSGAAAFIHFADETEVVEDTSGDVKVAYTVVLQITFRSWADTGEAMMADL